MQFALLWAGLRDRETSMFSPELFDEAPSTFAARKFVSRHHTHVLRPTSLAEATSNGYSPISEAEGKTEN